ncbi:hypothetical protein M1N11_05470, partial [Peptococcaceae bacterium]|nr:hypothetical protein [Peptococcaceae bacterium]
DLGDYAYYADGQKVPLKTQGNSILVPTEEGLVPVPIEEFDVVMVDEQIMLVAEENPLKFVPVAVAIAALKKAGVAVTTTTIKAATVLIAAGKKVTAASVRGVVRAFSLIRKANEVLAREIGKRPLTWWSVTQWLEGQCILPWCAARTPGGPTGDFFCRNCAKSIGAQIYGPKIF